MPTSWPVIVKTEIQRSNANLADYQSECERFTWDDARKLLSYLPGGSLNICHEAVDRHVEHGQGSNFALRWLGRKGDTRNFTYSDLQAETSRFANVLAAHGIERNDSVFSLLGRVPELYIAALGTLKHGSAYSPLFSAFGPEPVRMRMEIGRSAALVTTKSLYKRKVEAWRNELPTLKCVFLIDAHGEDLPDGTIDLASEMERRPETFETVETRPEDRALIHFTSGTTGRPKGALHVHEAVVAHAVTARFALDLRQGDIFWCTADPGWVTGTSYGIIAPLVLGATMIVDEGEYDAERWYEILKEQKVNVWYTAPTAIRMLMKYGEEHVRSREFAHLRFMASVGEPLNPEAVMWSMRAFGMPFHDNWWQTETGGIMIANFAAEDVKPGSMGRPLPGIEAGIVERQDGAVREITEENRPGELALKVGWPSMMRGYLNEEERYRKCFAGEWYLTGDLAYRDGDGYFWFVGRADDLIKSSGHLIGPFEVESALIEHEAVAEAAVIGLPDETAGETVKAYVVLNPGFVESEALVRDIMAHARKRLGPAVAPRMIEPCKTLPHTRSGKVMRRLLKARELGLPEGDTSTLESDK
ncbi:acetate--CoA ligase [Stappia sp. GBMRC 2046]|uniref:acetate--CoA ligase n=1 Tax=Stappia sediminis TaxID=2692190 RepID=A0A7X3LRZ9_9HYPH|nr:acetate--CoA ligase [Stappia sediminis]MXN64028.1 acetate--CoA ligase [Stappia sediminis]